MRRLPAASLVWLAGAAGALSIGVAAAPMQAHFAGRTGTVLPASAPQPVRTAAPVSLAPIIALAPFGRVAVQPAAVAEAPVLDLSLRGVVVAASSGASRAIISGAAGPAEVYDVGEAIGDRASLEAVFDDHVVVRFDGREVALRFPEPRAVVLEGVESEAGPDAAEEEDFPALRALLADAGGGDARGP